MSIVASKREWYLQCNNDNIIHSRNASRFFTIKLILMFSLNSLPDLENVVLHILRRSSCMQRTAAQWTTVMQLWSSSSCPLPHTLRNVRILQTTIFSCHPHRWLFPPTERQWKYGSSPGSSSASWSSGSSSPPLSDDNNNIIMNNRNRTASLSTSDEGIVMDLMPKKVSASLTFVLTKSKWSLARSMYLKYHIIFSHRRLSPRLSIYLLYPDVIV